jgi:hypothetical protein
VKYRVLRALFWFAVLIGVVVAFNATMEQNRQIIDMLRQQQLLMERQMRQAGR